MVLDRLKSHMLERGADPLEAERQAFRLDFAGLRLRGRPVAMPGQVDWGALAEPVPFEAEDGEIRELPADAPGPPALPLVVACSRASVWSGRPRCGSGRPKRPEKRERYRRRS